MPQIIRNPAYAGSDQALVDTRGQSIGEAMNGISSAFLNTGQQDLQRAALAAAQQKSVEARQKQEAIGSIGDVFGQYLNQQPARAQFEAQSRDAANPDWQGPMTPAPEPFSFDPARFSRDAATVGDPSMLGKVLQLGAAMQGGARAPGVAVGAAPSGGHAATAQGIDEANQSELRKADQIARRNAEIAQRAEESKPIEVMAPDGTRSFAPRNAIPVGSQPVFTGTDEAKAYSAQRYLIPQSGAPASQGESAPISGAFLSPRSTEFTPGISAPPAVPTASQPATRASPIPQPVMDWLNPDKPKFQVIGEDQFGNKKYGYPPAPGAPDATPAQPAQTSGADLHGQDFLDTLDPQTASTVKGITEGRIPATGRVMQRFLPLAAQYEPGFTAQDYSTRLATAKSFDAGTAAGQVKSANQAIAHAQTALDLVDKLGNYSYLPGIANPIHQLVAGQTDPAYQNNIAQFRSTVNALGGELTKTFRGNTGALQDVEHWRQSMNELGSPEAIRGGIQGAMKLLNGGIEALADQYNRGMRSNKDPVELLSPRNQEIFQNLIVGTKAPGQQPQGAPTAANDPLASARDAIARGAPRDAVIQRLQQNGINPEGL